MSTTIGAQPWSVVSPYHELDIAESIPVTDSGGIERTVTLEEAGDRSVTVRVDSTRVRIPLAHFTMSTVAQRPADVVNVKEVEGIRIGADLTKHFMVGSKYSQTFVNLHKDARLYLGKAGEPISPPGRHIFPVADFTWNYADNWANAVPYGWHLGIDPVAERGTPLVAVTDGTVIAIHHYRPQPGEPENYWGNNLALLGDDGVLYCYIHWDALADGIAEGSTLKMGDLIGAVGRSGFETMPYSTHLHFEMLILKRPDRFHFAYELDPEVLPTPNRLLPPEAEGHVVNPYPYLVEWYLAHQMAG